MEQEREKKLREKEDKREAEEFSKWSSQFVVLAEGSAFEDREQVAQKLGKVADFVKSRKAVSLDEVAAEFDAADTKQVTRWIDQLE